MAIVYPNGEVKYAGQVLSVSHRSEWRFDDSYSWIEVRVWDGSEVVIVGQGDGVATADLLDGVGFGKAEEWEEQQRELRGMIATTQRVMTDWNRIRNGSVCRVTAGRKLPIGETVVVVSNPFGDQFNRYKSNVNVDHDGNIVRYVDANNLEVDVLGTVKRAGEGEQLDSIGCCKDCKTCQPMHEFVYSLRSTFNRGPGSGLCLSCEVEHIVHEPAGHEVHGLAWAFASGNGQALYPLIDCLIENGNESLADELKKLHKVNAKVKRKPKSVPVAV